MVYVGHTSSTSPIYVVVLCELAREREIDRDQCMLLCMLLYLKAGMHGDLSLLDRGAHSYMYDRHSTITRKKLMRLLFFCISTSAACVAFTDREIHGVVPSESCMSLSLSRYTCRCLGSDGG